MVQNEKMRPNQIKQTAKLRRSGHFLGFKKKRWACHHFAISKGLIAQNYALKFSVTAK
jgi:hypothetical protein